jgi:hypothetical protein
LCVWGGGGLRQGLTMQSRLTLNSLSSFLSLLNAGITDAPPWLGNVSKPSSLLTFHPTFRTRNLITCQHQFDRMDIDIFPMDEWTQLTLLPFNLPSDAEILDFIIFVDDKMTDLLIALCFWGGSWV